MYLASFRWPDYDEPLMVGRNRGKLTVAARDKAIRENGSGLVFRPRAMNSEKITLQDILVEEIEVLGGE